MRFSTFHHQILNAPFTPIGLCNGGYSVGLSLAGDMEKIRHWLETESLWCGFGLAIAHSLHLVTMRGRP